MVADLIDRALALCEQADLEMVVMLLRDAVTVLNEDESPDRKSDEG